MQPSQQISQLVEQAFHLARSKFKNENRNWIDLSFRLAGRVSLMPLTTNIQRAGELDLVLRAIEDEFNSNVGAGGSPFSFHYQAMFSETWVVACYEMLRAIKQREWEISKKLRATNSTHAPDGISTLSAFKSVFRDLELLRMPMAKYEIAKERDELHQPLPMRRNPPNDNATDDVIYDKTDPARSHIMPAGLSSRGSMVWQVLDAKLIKEYWVERRDLADRLLKLNDEVEPAGLREARLATSRMDL
jgi:hypothetical protein